MAGRRQEEGERGQTEGEGEHMSKVEKEEGTSPPLEKIENRSCSMENICKGINLERQGGWRMTPFKNTRNLGVK